MMFLQNLKGFYAGGRDIYPDGFTFSNIYTDCNLDPDTYTYAYTTPKQVSGISNIFDLQVLSTVKSKSFMTLWYKLSATQFSTPRTIDSPSVAGYTEITSDTFNITGITNSYWISFGVDSADTTSTESTGVTLYSISISPGLTLSGFNASVLCTI